jgi:hypothetical protein
MNNCILCEKNGKSRRFFLENESLCDSDYIDYLEILIVDMTGEVTIESANEAFSKLKISLRPEAQSLHTRQFTTRKRRSR